MAARKLTAERARELFEHRGGSLFYRVRCNKKLPGSIAGSADGSGYLRIKVDGVGYRAHRVVWLVVFGAWPDGDIDHINGDTLDNRVENLRVVTHAENMRNTRLRSSNTSGYTGVFKAGQRWRAVLKVSGKKVGLGTFDSPEQAALARKMANERYGFHANHGRSFHA